ncbi:hypothetical protein GHT09_007769 [Marmota monax]|uniref:Uncharacterized protein n=1 Tax=Marmota monax TaxID=9995 RepID=A0A834QMG7_MARMO|nr:hypothetical protein GHT09_007769 [Marmota monax]
MEATKGKVEHSDIAEGTESTEVLAPGEATRKLKVTKERIEHGDISKSTEMLAPKSATRKMEETKERMEHGDMSGGTEILVPKTATRKMEDTKKKAGGSEWGEISEEPFWMVNASGIILIMLVVLSHIYFF